MTRSSWLDHRATAQLEVLKIMWSDKATSFAFYTQLTVPGRTPPWQPIRDQYLTGSERTLRSSYWTSCCFLHYDHTLLRYAHQMMVNTHRRGRSRRRSSAHISHMFTHRAYQHTSRALFVYDSHYMEVNACVYVWASEVASHHLEMHAASQYTKLCVCKATTNTHFYSWTNEWNKDTGSRCRGEHILSSFSCLTCMYMGWLYGLPIIIHCYLMCITTQPAINKTRRQVLVVRGLLDTMPLARKACEFI